MEGRAALRMDAQLPKAREPMGVPHRKLPRNGPPRMPSHDAQIFMSRFYAAEPRFRPVVAKIFENLA